MTISLRHCVREAQHGNHEAILFLLREFEPLIRKYVKRYYVYYDSLEEAISTAQHAVVTCVFAFDLTKADYIQRKILAAVDHGNSLLHDVLDYMEKDKFDKILMNPPYGGSEKKDVMSHFPDDLADSETADLFMSVILYRLKQGGRAAVVLPDGFLFGTDNTKVNIKKKLMAECDLHTIIRLPGSVFAPYTSITTNILFFDRTHPTEKTWFYRLDMPEGYKHFSKTKPMRLEHFEPVREWWDDRREIIEGDFPKAKCYTAEEIADNGYNLDLCGFPHEEEEILEPMELIQQYQTRRAALNQQIDTILARITAKLEENE